MRQITIGLASINTRVGAFETNTDRVIAFAGELSDRNATVASFQEQVISGYPAEDLVQWKGFVEAQWEQLRRFAEETKDLAPVFTLGLTVEDGGSLYNCVSVVYGGKIVGIVPKEKLPTYGVFYEMRTFSLGVPGRVTEVNGIPFGDLIFRFPFGTMAVEVCEDIWSPDGPMRRRAYSGAELIINASASPWRAGVLDTRREMLKTRSADNQATVVYVNQYGGQDSLVFDGGGFVCQNGQMHHEAQRWGENMSVVSVDLDRTQRLRHENTTWRKDCEAFQRSMGVVRTINVEEGPTPLQSTEIGIPLPASKSFFLPPSGESTNPRTELFEDFIQAMKTGLDGIFEKVGSFDRIGISLSGGKDSVLSLIVVWLYAQDKFSGLGDQERAEKIRDFIHCFSMPSRFNSDTTKSISALICKELGVTFKEISIEEAYEREVKATSAMLNPGEELTPVTKQNIQARIRGERMWNWANTARALWIQTGNMSEKAVGYTTIGGDMMGGYSLIGNLPKTVIIELLAFLRSRYGWNALTMLLETKASAELTEDQEDEKDLMPFPVLDACIHLFAAEKLLPSEVYAIVRSMWTDDELLAMRPDYKPGMLKEWVEQFVRLFFRSIFKWVQAPQSVHLGSLELDRERALQLPVVQSMQWLEADLEKLREMPD